MHIFFFCAVIAATFALYLIARKEENYKKQAYIAAIAVPVCAIIFYFVVLAPQNNYNAPPIADQQRKEMFLNTLAKDESEIKSKLENKPGDIDLTIELASLQMQQTQYDKAIALLSDTLSKNVGHKDLTTQLAVAYFSKGLFLAEQKKTDAAIASMKKAQLIAPKDTPFIKDLQMFITMLENKKKTAR